MADFVSYYDIANNKQIHYNILRNYISGGSMKKRILAITLLLTCCLSANAYDTYYVPPTGAPEFQFNIYHPGEIFKIEGEEQDAVFEIPQEYIVPLFQAAQNWGDRIEGTPLTPIIYSYTSIYEYNAAAGSPYISVAESPYKVTKTNAKLHNWTIITPPEELAETDGDGFVFIGLGISEQNPGWQPYSGLHPLYHNELPDINPVMLHEMMHSLGVTSGVNTFFEDDGDNNYYFSESATDPLTIYDSHLRIYTGDADPITDPANEIAPSPGEVIGLAGYDVETYSPYFIGTNVIKALGNDDDYDTARQNIVDNGGLVNYSDYYFESGVSYPKVYALPIHPTDGENENGNITYDLSHIELRNSYMSHQDFRNWLVPMEVELALMKDLGYNVELRKYFGKSYYLNNQTDTYTAGFGEWEGTAYTGAPSTINQAVGIHVYGDNNNITQTTNDITMLGEGSIGVRIDGVGNTYTLDSNTNIEANGKENLGIAVTWGSNHEVNIDNGASVVASGEDGIAASFDYGSNIFGTSASNIKGSYINYMAEMGFNFNPDIENQGALVTNFNVDGTLQGDKAAIYISDNAYVENININNGAQIKGDIISEWNSLSSSNKALVLVYDAGEDSWRRVNPENPAEIYYTNLNFNGAGGITVDGDITGENDIFNTLKLNNYSNNLTVTGNNINVYSINNTGTLNINKVNLAVQNGEITGNGSIDVISNSTSNGKLSISPEITNIENTINLNDNSELSTLNNETTEDIAIAELNTGTNTSLSFDLGDTFNITSATGSIKFNQIRVDDDTMKELEDGDNYRLFAIGSDTLDFTASPDANVYYNGNKYSISQSDVDAELLQVILTETGKELADAVGDSTTANYIVTEDALTKDIGTIQGGIFTISGNDIDVNGNSGLVIDGSINKDGTTMKTGIAGASDANITLANNAELLVSAEDKDIVLGDEGEVAIAINNSEVKLDAADNTIEIQGSIAGTGPNTSNNLIFTGDEISIGDVGTVIINSDAQTVNMYGTSTNTIMNMNGTILNVENDSYLASDGSNTLNLNSAELNFANNKTTDINLAGMNVVSENKLAIDIDLKNLASDKFVFQNANDLIIGVDSGFVIQNANLLNSNFAFTNKEYYIPFISSAYNNQNLLNGIEFSERNLITPIFKYNLKYTEDDASGGFLLSRGAEKQYNSYNPAVVVSPVAAQFGGYLSQLNSYEQAFQNLDIKMLMTREERKAFKMANRYASEVQPKVFSPTYLPEKDHAAWFRPYASFEKVKLNNGPKVDNIMYGSYFGGDSDMKELSHGWDFQWSAYAGYNGSHQNYSGNSIYQNGGNLGATGIWYKNDFFTALTANVGASVADASTMYGSEDFPMLMSGIASKTGYNWELAKGKFIIQPSYLMSYTFVNTFDYTNAAGVRIKSDPLNAINITPGLKFIGNLKNGWQPYAGIQMVWNIMDKTDFHAQNVNLPQLSVKPYFQYGAGLQKRWGERFTGFLQAMIRNGGRNGIALSAGFRWAIGK